MKNEKYEAHKSSLGMDANILALLSYIAAIIFGFIPVLRLVPFVAPLIIFMMEKSSKFVKFHAMQAMILDIIAAVLALIFAGIPTLMLMSGSLGGFLSVIMSGLYVIVSLAIMVVSIIAMVKAYGYIEFHLPAIGDIAAKQAEKANYEDTSSN